jgi:hypothetical protein
MLFNPGTAPPQQIRTRCRNPRCAAKLPVPVENSREAFCCAGCDEQYYHSRFRVCEQLFRRKTSRKVVCSRESCRHQIKRYPEKYAPLWVSKGVAHNDARSAHSTGLKIGTKSDRPYRVIASPGADLRPINLLPPEPSDCEIQKRAAAREFEAKLRHGEDRWRNT